MILSISIVTGIALIIFLIYMLRKKPESTNNTNNYNGKKEQFNPEKVSGMMPKEQMSDVKDDKNKK